MNQGYIVHYLNQKHYSTLKKILEINKEKASDAKEKWMSLGGNLHH